MTWENRINEVAATLADTTHHTHEQWLPAVRHGWVYGLTEAEMVQLGESGIHPAQVEPILTTLSARCLPSGAEKGDGR